MLYDTGHDGTGAEAPNTCANILFPYIPEGGCKLRRAKLRMCRRSMRRTLGQQP